MFATSISRSSPNLFTDVFNLLISWVEGGAKVLETWRKEAPSFIAMLQKPKDRAKDDTELEALKERLKLLNDFGTVDTLSLGPGVTDKGLSQLREFVALSALNLHSKGITDAGLKELKDVGKLLQLKIYDAPITDAGLMHLAPIPNLNCLSLAQGHVARNRASSRGAASFEHHPLTIRAV